MPSATVIISLLLVGFSSYMLTIQLRTRRRGGDEFQGAKCFPRFYKTQFRRRLQLNLMLGVCGFAILASLWLPKNPLLVGSYWIGIIFWVLWILILALIDLLVTRGHFRLLEDDQRIEHAQLQAKLIRTDGEENGR
jgi:sterol desaturase/sphingolipid hydroxylase (fatty acid hydroxylase superfamily)